MNLITHEQQLKNVEMPGTNKYLRPRSTWTEIYAGVLPLPGKSR